jgi:hypothetical protein
MRYIEYQKIWVGGTLQQYVYWEYAATFSDHSGNSHPATPAFRTTTSDPDVSAYPFSFQPVSEAKAPAYSLANTVPTWVTAPVISGNFTTSTNSTLPGAAIIEALAAASATPEQIPLTILTGFFVLTCSVSISYFMRKHSAGSVFIKSVLVGCIMGLLIAVRLHDFWMLVFFAFFAIAFCIASQHKGGWS